MITANQAKINVDKFNKKYEVYEELENEVNDKIIEASSQGKNNIVFVVNSNNIAPDFRNNMIGYGYSISVVETKGLEKNTTLVRIGW